MQNLCRDFMGLINPIHGAIAQELVDVFSFLNSLRIILPTGPLTDFNQTGVGFPSTLPWELQQQETSVI